MDRERYSTGEDAHWVPGEVDAEVIPLGESRLRPEDERRKEELEAMVRKARVLDKKIFMIPSREPALRRMELAQTLMALEVGEEDVSERRPLGQGVNGQYDVDPEGKLVTNDTQIRFFAGDERYIPAVSKSLGGESVRVYDPQEKGWYVERRVWNPQTQMMEVTRRETDADVSYQLSQWARKRFPEMQASIAKAYHLSPDEIPFAKDRQSSRWGVPPETSVKREYFASRISILFALGVVPPVALRLDESGMDICSVQEAILNKEETGLAKTMDREVVESLRELGPKHPLAKSLMRIAALDYLVNSYDGQPGNIVIRGNQCYRADNTLCEGLSYMDGKIRRSVDEIVSLPIEIVSEHSSWELDAEAVSHLERVYKACLRYLEAREKMRGVDVTGAGAEIKYLSELFIFLFGKREIAGEEFKEFILRLKKLITDKKPPNMVGKPLMNSPELQSAFNVLEQAQSSSGERKAA